MLLNHVNSEQVNPSDLGMLPEPTPMTETHTPVHHVTVRDGIRNAFLEGGWQWQEEETSVSHDATRMFGIAKVGNGHPDYQTMVGYRNSHDMSFPAAVCLGSKVFVCDNLAFSGEIKLARRHTRHILRDLPRMITRAVGALGDYRHSQDERIERYKTTAVDDRDALALIGRAIESRVIPQTFFSRVAQEWRKPSHPEFDGRTVWSLFNAFTEHMKKVNPQDLPARTMALGGLCDMKCEDHSGVWSAA